MALAIDDAIRTTMVTAISNAIDAGVGAGLIRIYDGVQPAKGGAATTLLAELTFTDPSATSIATGVLTFDTITQDSSANATATATWFRMLTSAAAFVLDGTVTATGGGGDMTLTTTSIVATQPVSISSATITAGNN